MFEKIKKENYLAKTKKKRILLYGIFFYLLVCLTNIFADGLHVPYNINELYLVFVSNNNSTMVYTNADEDSKYVSDISIKEGQVFMVFAEIYDRNNEIWYCGQTLDQGVWTPNSNMYQDIYKKYNIDATKYFVGEGYIKGSNVKKYTDDEFEYCKNKLLENGVISDKIDLINNDDSIENPEVLRNGLFNNQTAVRNIIITLILTIIIEIIVGICFGIRNKKAIVILIFTNILTNLPLNFIFYANVIKGNIFFAILMAETVVIIIETCVYYVFIKNVNICKKLNRIINILMFTLISNIASYIICEIVFSLWKF